MSEPLLASIRLAGRRAELEVIAAECRRVIGGGMRVILMEGPAGVGKSRLMAEVLAPYRESASVLTARAYRLGVTASFGPWIEALDRRALETGNAVVRDWLAPAAGEGMGREELLDGMVSTLVHLSERGPVLVGIDDIHLFDASSWEALRFFGRRLWNRPVGIVATSRTGRFESNVLAQDVLVALDDDGLLRRLAIRPLNAGELADLARSVLANTADGVGAAAGVPEALVEWLMDRSRGHPLFAIRLLHALIDQRGDLAHPSLTRLPPSLTHRIAAELSVLDEDQRSILDALAVMDLRADPFDIAQVVELPLERVGALLEGLEAARLVVDAHGGGGAAYEVSHPLVRDCIYELMGGARRMASHRRVARVLLERGRWGAAAGHFARSSSRADDESLEALCSAMRQAESLGLYREALATLDALLEILPEGDRRWRRVLESVSWQAEWVVDHLAEQGAESASRAMRRIGAVVERSSDRVAQGIVQFHLAAFQCIGAAELDEAAVACRRAIELFDEAGERERSMLARNELVWVHACRGDLQEAVAWGRAQLGMLEKGTEARAEIQLLGSTAYAAMLMGQWQEAEDCYERARARARATGSRYREAWGLVQSSLGLALRGHLEEAIASLEAAQSVGATLAADAIGLERLALCRYLRGDLHECIRLVEESDARRPARGSRRRGWSLALQAIALGECGRRRRAERALEQARQSYGSRHLLDWSAWVPRAAAFLARQAGDLPTAVKAYGAAAERYRAMGAKPLEADVLFDAVAAGLEAADPRTSDLSRRLRELADAVGGELLPVLADIAEAEVRLVQKAGIAPMPSRVEEAARTLESLGFGMHASRAWLTAGRLLDAQGDTSPAEAWERSARLSAEHGAVWRRDRALALLRGSGAEGRRRVGSILGPQSLTEREREVASLAARGYTARQIGEKLFIGKRTVETHLTHIYPKLGVGSKRELVIRAPDLGLAQDTR